MWMLYFNTKKWIIQIKISHRIPIYQLRSRVQKVPPQIGLILLAGHCRLTYHLVHLIMGTIAHALPIELEVETHLVPMLVQPFQTREGYHWLQENVPQHISIMQSLIHYHLINLHLERLVIMVGFPSMEKWKHLEVFLRRNQILCTSNRF